MKRVLAVTVGLVAALLLGGTAWGRLSAGPGPLRPSLPVVAVQPSTSTPGDISGPCDEAEHADDPRCTGVVVPGGGGTPGNAPGDISGPCDEAEHVHDPRCAGVTFGGGAPAPGTVPAAGGNVDVSGPCDEAEHAGDPRCTGGAVDEDRSNRGPGGPHDGDGHRRDGADGNRDGADGNRGPGGGDGNSNSGPGGGDGDGGGRD